MSAEAQQQHDHDDADPPVDETASAAGDELEPGAETESTADEDALDAQLNAGLDDLHSATGELVTEPQQQPPAPQPSEKEVEETYKKLDKETERHVKRIAELVGDAFAYLVPCELCDPSMPGFRWPREPADEVKVAVRMAIGDRQPENWQADQYSRRCDACEGLGEVVTGSQVRGQTTLPCMICDARGWVPIGDERRSGVVRPLPVVPRPDVEQPQAPLPADDPPEVAALKRAGYVVIAPTRAE